MVDRYRVWLGAGVLAGGVSAAMLAGAGVAAADDGAPSAGGSQASTGADDSDNAAPNAGPSEDGQTETEGGDETEGDEDESSDETEDDDETEVEDEDEVEDESSDDDQGGDYGKDAPAGEFPKPDDAIPATDPSAEPEPEPATEAEAEPVAVEPVPAAEPAPDGVESAPEAPSTLVESIETDLAAPEGAAVMRVAAAGSPWTGASAFNLFDVVEDLSTMFYNWYTGTMQFLAGPPRAPFGSRVRVERSSLTLANGVVVSADWYFPPGKTEPKGLIYLQHGMLASAAFYSATAAYLAEKTNSIVVAPTLTWNVFDTDDYPLMLPSTHRVVADLFTGDRAALTASAREAGFHGVLPTRLVLAGHSAGGGLAVGAARYLVERGGADALAGVVMLDGAGLVGVLSADLAKIPRSIPVYNLAAVPDSWNNRGHASARLQQARPDMFTGVLVQGGHHSDSMQSASGIVQFMAYLATGFSSPWNVEANEILTAGWINDMLDGTYTERLYRSSVSPVSLVTGSWFAPPSSVQLNGPTPYAAAAMDVCPVAPVVAVCTDPLPRRDPVRV
ncbi:alpha/beta hydrolase [Mycobacterium sp. ZZG]